MFITLEYWRSYPPSLFLIFLWEYSWYRKYKGKTYLIFPYLYISMVRLRACCAASVMASASSRITILWRPLGRVTFCCANILIRFRTTSIPLSLEAFNSKTASLNEEPSKCLARHKIVVVFPTPIEKMNFHENKSMHYSGLMRIRTLGFVRIGICIIIFHKHLLEVWRGIS